MKINELKIGDRVKYDFGNTVLNIPSHGESVIEEFVAPDRIKLNGIHFDFDIKYIVSKLEPQYKEIPIEKEEPAPKSFKFDVWPVRLEGVINKNIKKIVYNMSGYDKNRNDFYELPCPDWIKFGKTYTIEIKEKK